MVPCCRAASSEVLWGLAKRLVLRWTTYQPSPRFFVGREGRYIFFSIFFCGFSAFPSIVYGVLSVCLRSIINLSTEYNQFMQDVCFSLTSSCLFPFAKTFAILPPTDWLAGAYQFLLQSFAGSNLSPLQPKIKEEEKRQGREGKKESKDRKETRQWEDEPNQTRQQTPKPQEISRSRGSWGHPHLATFKGVFFGGGYFLFLPARPSPGPPACAISLIACPFEKGTWTLQCRSGSSQLSSDYLAYVLTTCSPSSFHAERYRFLSG